jgi:hypothetical protein
MSFDLPTVAPLRKVRILRGYGALVVAVVLATALWFAPSENMSPVVNTIVVSAIALFGVWQIWLARRTNPSDVARLPEHLDPNRLDRLPPGDRARVLRRYLILAPIAFSLMSAMTAWEIGRATERVTLWAPLAFLYDQFGYWPAVLAPLVGGAMVWGGLAVRLRDALREAGRSRDQK